MWAAGFNLVFTLDILPLTHWATRRENIDTCCRISSKGKKVTKQEIEINLPYCTYNTVAPCPLGGARPPILGTTDVRLMQLPYLVPYPACNYYFNNVHCIYFLDALQVNSPKKVVSARTITKNKSKTLESQGQVSEIVKWADNDQNQLCDSVVTTGKLFLSRQCLLTTSVKRQRLSEKPWFRMSTYISGSLYDAIFKWFFLFAREGDMSCFTGINCTMFLSFL